jgi:hypothetical protein
MSKKAGSGAFGACFSPVAASLYTCLQAIATNPLSFQNVAIDRNEVRNTIATRP